MREIRGDRLAWVRLPLYVTTDCFGPGGLAPRDAELLRELGFNGACATMPAEGAPAPPAAVRRALEAQGLALLSVAWQLDVRRTEAAAAVAAVDAAGVAGAALLELSLTSSAEQDAASSPRGDAPAAAIVSAIAGVLRSGRRVALLPRQGALLARVEDAVRLGMRVNRPHVGVTLCWSQRQPKEEPAALGSRLDLALPRLWNVRITPAPDGEADAAALFVGLARRGYHGTLTVETRAAGATPAQIETFLRRVAASCRRPR